MYEENFTHFDRVVTETVMQDAMTLAERRILYATLLSVLLLLVVVNSGTTCSIWLTLVLRPLMHGVSLFKTNFLLLFIILSALGTLYRPVSGSERWARRWKSAAILCSALACGVGMGTFLWLAYTLHLPVGKYAYFFSDGFTSINQFAHLHVTKAGLFHLLSAVGLGEVARHADAGKPFAMYLYPGVSILVLALAGVCLTALLALAPRIVRSWSGWRQVAALLLFGLAGSHVVKCLIDGGLLAYDFLPSCVVVYLLVRHSEGIELGGLIRRVWFRTLLVAILFLALVSIFSVDIAMVWQPLFYGFFFGIYTLLVCALLLSGTNIKRVVAVAGPVAILCGAFYYQHTARDIGALARRLTAEERVHISRGQSLPSLASPATVTDQSAAVAGMRVIDAYRREGENPLRNRSMLITTTEPVDYSGLIFALRVLKADSLVTFESTEYVTIRGGTAVGENADSLFVFRVGFNPEFFPTQWREPATIVDENNKFAMLFFLDGYFRVRGLRDYVLIPLYYEARAWQPLES